MKRVKAEDIEFNKNKLINKFCEDCVLGKMTKLPHKTIQKEKEDDHIVIHSDLMGPMKKRKHFLHFKTLFFSLIFLFNALAN